MNLTSLAPLTRRIDALGIRTLVGITAGLALLSRLLYLLVATGDLPLRSDAAQYDFLAKNLAAGDGYVDRFPQLELHATAFRPPGYPALLGLVYKVLWPSPGVGRALNVVIGVTVVAVLTLLVKRHLGGRAALTAGVGAAVLPNLIANDTYILTEPLSLLLLLAILAWVLDDRWVLAGVATGALVLTRPSAQYLVMLLGLYVAWRIGWRRALGFLLVAALVVAPWVGRNWTQLGSPVLVTSNGFNYAALYSPPADARGAFIDATEHPYFADRRLDQFDEVTWDQNLRETAVDRIRERPAVIPEVVGRNAQAFFELKPSYNRSAEERDGRSLTARAWTFWVIWPVVILGVWGIATRRRHPIVLLAGGIAAYFTLASLVFVAAPRLRSPVELMLLICGAALLAPRKTADDADADEAPELDPASTRVLDLTDERPQVPRHRPELAGVSRPRSPRADGWQ